MDVRTDQATMAPDTSVTAIVEQQPAPDTQGQLFADANPTYADTDRIPAVSRQAARPGPSRWLRVLVVIVAVVVVAAAATLGLVKAGVIDKSSSGPTHPTGTAQHHHATKTSVPLVTQVSTGNAAATYRVDIAAYTVTVVTTTGRSWVTIGAAGQHPAYQGVLEPNSSQKELLLGPSQVSIGAGGTKVIVTSGARSFTLTPPAAPFNYSFVINKS